jgi:RES domain-containing protein
VSTEHDVGSERTLAVSLLWRISRHDELDGIGGEKADGRWHTAAKGKRIVYLSEHPAVALIEILANLKGNPRLFPDAYRMMKLAVDQTVWAAALVCEPLPEDWRRDLAQTRALGDAWLTERSSALLRVPSAPSPESSNYLLNPLHLDARTLTIQWSKWVTYDKRLFHLHEPSR